MKLLHRALASVLAGMLLTVCLPHAARAQTESAPASIRIVELQGTVEIAKGSAPSTAWTAGQMNQVLAPGDRLRTGPNSRVALRWTSQSVVPFGASTELEILPPRNGDSQSGLRLIRGILSFFHRDEPGRIRVVTRGASAGIEGTEFVVAVNDSDRTTLSVVDGRVRFENELASLTLTNGQQAVAEPGQAPIQTAGFIVNNVLQWAFYYPAVLDPSDLKLTADEQSALAESLAAYRSGDLLNALARYPQGRQPGSGFERVYYAALLLSVGQVEATEAVLAELPSGSDGPQRLAAALRDLVAAVKRETRSEVRDPQSPTELLAASYYEQSRAIRGDSLEAALELASEAAVKSPEFGFAWTRVAELEFSFGRIGRANDALDRGLALAPRNAQAVALKGFLLAANGRTGEAVDSFNRALEIDSALANAWLGRGLCRIRRGDVAGGREDLMIAAALEPQRAELRSYLGKAHEAAGNYPLAEKELKLASRLDPNDPTPHLYSALVHHQNNRVNDAIRDLEKSQQLNDNRSVYRSQLMLNQDHAVRSANLARIYADAGMTDLSVREASRAVIYDYANYSAHMFLAYSYDALRDPGNQNLRYGTPTLSEYYLASILAPVEAGPISSAVSQGEYSRLFSQDRLGLISSTEYLSRGAWVQSFAQYGTFDTFNYSLEGTYRTDPGQYENNDYEAKHLSLSLKQRITPQDDIFLSIGGFKAEAGDTTQRYNPNTANPVFRSTEDQIPNVILGYHREWQPGVHTLLLLARMTATFDVVNPNSGALITFDVDGELTAVRVTPIQARIQSSQDLYGSEIQQIFQADRNTLVFGGRFQFSDFDHRYLANVLAGNPHFTFTNAATQNLDTEFMRFSVYGYDSLQVLESLMLVGGLSYDWIQYPRSSFSPPFSEHQDRKDGLFPKVGLVWNPASGTTVRAAYTRSLAGVSLDQSLRIEPTQVAGINQAYRSLIPFSVGGNWPGAEFETMGIVLEQKFKTGTYLSLNGEILNSEYMAWHSSFYLDPFISDELQPLPNGFALKRRMDYREQSLVFTADQLIGKTFSAGFRYRLTHVDFETAYPQTFHLLEEDVDGISSRSDSETLLHQINLYGNWNHHSGLFSRVEAVWYRQENRRDLSAFRGDDFWHFNALGGYRFWNRRARVEAGILNITDRDYRLHPLAWYNDVPRERTFIARVQLSF